MRTAALIVLMLTISPLAMAQSLTLAEIKAKGAMQLAPDDVKQLLPGAKIASRTQTGSTRSWQNQPEGTFVASSDNRGNPGAHGATTGKGTWRLDEKGTYCVTIDWPRTEEKWCRFIFKAGDKYYAVGKLDDGAPVYDIEIAK